MRIHLRSKIQMARLIQTRDPSSLPISCSKTTELLAVSILLRRIGIRRGIGRKKARLRLFSMPFVSRISTKASIQRNRGPYLRNNFNFRPVILPRRFTDVIHLTERNCECTLRSNTPKTSHHVEQCLCRRHLCGHQTERFAYPLTIDRKISLYPLLPGAKGTGLRRVQIELQMQLHGDAFKCIRKIGCEHDESKIQLLGLFILL